MWLIVWLIALIELARACPGNENAEAQVERQTQTILQAYTQHDPSRLDQAEQRLNQTLHCLTRPRGLAQAHQAMALIAYAQRNRVGSSRAWRAARHLDPDLQPALQMVGPDHDLWGLFSQATLPVGTETTRLPGRPRGGWWVDGQRGLEVPNHRAFTLLARGRDGAILHSGYYYEAHQALLDVDGVVPKRRGAGALVVGTGFAMAGAAVLGWAATTENSLRTVSSADIERTAQVANRRYAVGASLGGLGLALASVGAVVRW